MFRPYRIVFFCLVGCDRQDIQAPTIEAHRGGAGSFPENSIWAFENSFHSGVGSIEFDVVVTKDNVPIVHHGAWLEPTHCTHADGLSIALEDKPKIAELTLEEIQSNFLCGGLPQAEFPDAQLIETSVMTLAELLELAGQYPNTTLHYDIKYEPNHSRDAETMALEIIDVVDSYSLPNPQYMTSFYVDMLQHIALLSDIELSLDWPTFTEHLNGNSDTLTGLLTEYQNTMGLADYVSTVENAGADGIGIPYQIIEKHQAQAAQQAGLSVQVWTLNTLELLDAYCAWPVDVIITDYPQKAPCF